MHQAPENEALAAAIVNFFRTEFGEEVVIEPIRPEDWPDNRKGFQIETDCGASFTFEIFGTTRAAVARAYLEHVRYVWQYMLNERKFIWFHRLNRRHRELYRSRLDRLEAWIRQNLPA